MANIKCHSRPLFLFYQNLIALVEVLSSLVFFPVASDAFSEQHFDCVAPVRLCAVLSLCPFGFLHVDWRISSQSLRSTVATTRTFVWGGTSNSQTNLRSRRLMMHHCFEADFASVVAGFLELDLARDETRWDAVERYTARRAVSLELAHCASCLAVFLVRRFIIMRYMMIIGDVQ